MALWFINPRYNFPKKKGGGQPPQNSRRQKADMKQVPYREQKLAARGGAIDWGTTLQAERSGVWFPMMAILQWQNPSDHTTAPGVDSASNRNEHREYFPGVKDSRYLGLAFPP